MAHKKMQGLNKMEEAKKKFETNPFYFLEYCGEG